MNLKNAIINYYLSIKSKSCNGNTFRKVEIHEPLGGF